MATCVSVSVMQGDNISDMKQSRVRTTTQSQRR